MSAQLPCMLLSSSSVFCPRTNLCPERFFHKPKVSLFKTYRLKNNLRLRNSWRVGVYYNGYPYFTSPRHPLESDLMTTIQGEDNGIGIVKFFQGKKIFITGATGFVGKALVEKLLRSTSVEKIYLLLKAEDEEAALAKLSKQIIHSGLLQCIKEKYGSSYQEFARQKLIPVVGNICEPNLGMDIKSAQAIMDNVEVIIASAASTTLNDRYDSLLESNAIAPQRLMRFAKACKNLKIFAHISTAYVNGKREGIIFEQPLVMGDNGRSENDEILLPSIPRLDLADEIQMAFKSSSSDDYEATKNLKKLGQERANFFGWNNAYQLTKAMGEMVLNEIKESMPLLIIRPPGIESSYKQPFPGWIQGNRVYDPIIISYGRGQLPAFLGDPEVVMDIIPIDFVVNATLAAVAKHGALSKPETNVYQLSSSALNPLKYSDFFECLYQYFKTTPLDEDESITRIKYIDNFNDFCKYTREEMFLRTKLKHHSNENGTDRKVLSKCRAKVMYVEQLFMMYEFLGFFGARFHNGNTQKLLQEMSEEERLSFEANVSNINWSNYLQETHIPGLTKHVINAARISI